MVRTLALALIAIFLAPTGVAVARAKMNSGLVVERLAKQQLDRDLKIEVQRTNVSVCGSNGPVYVISIKLRKISKVLDEKTHNVRIDSKWQAIKKYGLPFAELKKGSRPELMDADSCSE